jgi:hypothetical protein
VAINAPHKSIIMKLLRQLTKSSLFQQTNKLMKLIKLLKKLSLGKQQNDVAFNKY